MNRWLLAFVVDWAVMITAYILTPLPIAILIIGTRQHALGMLGHDGAHGSAFKNRKLNEFFTKLCFGCIGILLKPYRKFHMPHHAYFGSLDDPEIDLKNDPSWWHFSWKYVGRDLMGLTAKEALNMWRHAGGTYCVSLVLFLVLAVVSPMFAVAYFIALGTSFVACNRQRMIIEHGEVYHYGELQKAILFPHNGWLHAEHHADPSTPFHRLKSRAVQAD